MIDYNAIRRAVEMIANTKVPKAKGLECIAVHLYTDEQSNVLYAKPRYKNLEKGEKWIRSFSQTSDGNWQMKEPDFTVLYPQGKGKKPLYFLPDLINNTQDTVYIFEGEQKADLANRLGFLATTTGSSTSVTSHNWQPLAGRKVVLWRDNDDAGKKWLSDMLLELQAVGGVDVSIIDVEKIDLPKKGDIVDFKDRLDADGEDDLGIAEKIRDLPILPDSQVRKLLGEQSEQSITQSALLEPSMPYEKGYFEHYSDGVYHVVYDDEGEINFKLFICSSLTIKARTRDEYGEKWGIWCQWYDRDSKLHDLSLPISLLQGDSREYRKLFADGGLVINTNSKARSYLDAYLNLHPTAEMALCTHKTGWHGEQFVLPHRVFGKGQAIVYQAETTPVTHYAQKGTLIDWRQQISIPMATQHKVAFAIACAFAGQLLPLVNENGGGFHFVGTSSKGKSLTAKIACSVWGHPKSYIHSWRATSNAQENIAFQHNHGFIALDEINLANPSTIGDVTYMLADGEGKDRMTKTGQNRPTLQWQVMYLSTGEETLESIQNSVNKRTKAGQEVRFVSLDAVNDDHLGIFDSLIGYATPAEQADALSQSASENYGTAGIAWLEYLTKDKAEVTGQALAIINRFLLPYKNLPSQARRVGRLFATVASAGELATQAGITGWQVGQAMSAAQQCFENWLDNFGRDGNHEERQIIKHIRLFIQQHGESRFSNWESPGFYQKVNNRVGFLTKDQDLYLFFQDAFAEVSQPFQVKTVISVLKKHKLLRTNEPTRNTFKIKLPNPNKSGRYYAILASILHYEIGESNDAFNSTGITGNMGNAVSPSAFDSRLAVENGLINMGTMGSSFPTIPDNPALPHTRPTLQSHITCDSPPISQ